MPKTSPTERLTAVLIEALHILAAHRTLQTEVQALVSSWGQMPQDEVLRALHDALDSAAIPLPTSIFEAQAYLRLNSHRIASARRYARRRRGQSTSGLEREPADALPDLQETEQHYAPLSLEDIEAKLKELGAEEEEG